jgi:1-acyl-sn-glycerol-3-phosphate acyltransferase
MMSPRSEFFKRYENVADQYGFDVASYKHFEPFIRLLYKRWFGVRITGIENIPADGSAVLFGNHSGVLPIDGCLLYDGVINNHPEPRRIRYLVTKFLLGAPVVGKFLRGFGCIEPDYEIAKDLLQKQEMVCFYPEAEKGTGKLFKDRYKLVEFHEGFVRAALETQSLLVPVVTIGGEETYPLLGNIKPMAKLLDAPYFPVTPFFPLLPFPFNVIPLPVRILICVWQPFKLKYGPEAAKDEALVSEIANDIRNAAQSRVNELLEIRTSPFSDWDMNQVNAHLRKTEFCSSDVNKHRLVAGVQQSEPSA